MINIIHKTVKPSHLEKLQIIQAVNKLMFLVIFIFSDSFFHLIFLGEKDFKKILFGALSRYFTWGMSKNA